ncbi:MAG: formylglycine-generating enzyme family protein [Thermoanaerobaculales bacterium]
MAGVSWYDAIMFCNWLSWKEDLDPCYKLAETGADELKNLRRSQEYQIKLIEAGGFRLPTADQWEAACRAGTTTSFSFGGDEAYLDRYAVYAANSKSGPAAVGSHLCNAWGLFDMHGNLWEWCWDGWDREGEGSYRVRRGGSWDSAARSCALAFRSWGDPSFRSYLGFRVAVVP